MNDGQQAALQSVESFLYLGRHIFLHLWSPPGPLHLVWTLSLSSWVHTSVGFRVIAGQSFNPKSMSSGASRARPLIIFSKATSALFVDGATASTQRSTLMAASRHLKSGKLIICVDKWGSMRAF